VNAGLNTGVFDEKHRQKMGTSIWLFGWLVGAQTRRNGFVFGGAPFTYKELAERTGYNPRSIEKWLAALKDAGYIEVTYTNWKKLRIRVLNQKKFKTKQATMDFSHPANQRDVEKVVENEPSRQSAGSLSRQIAGSVPANQRDSARQLAGSNKILRLSSNERPELPAHGVSSRSLEPATTETETTAGASPSPSPSEVRKAIGKVAANLGNGNQGQRAHLEAGIFRRKVDAAYFDATRAKMAPDDCIREAVFMASLTMLTNRSAELHGLTDKQLSSAAWDRIKSGVPTIHQVHNFEVRRKQVLAVAIRCVTDAAMEFWEHHGTSREVRAASP
jgi:hypothetical protein